MAIFVSVSWATAVQLSVDKNILQIFRLKRIQWLLFQTWEAKQKRTSLVETFLKICVSIHLCSPWHCWSAARRLLWIPSKLRALRRTASNGTPEHRRRLNVVDHCLSLFGNSLLSQWSMSKKAQLKFSAQRISAAPAPLFHVVEQTSWAKWLILQPTGLCNISGVISSTSSNNDPMWVFVLPCSHAHSLFFSPSLCVQKVVLLTNEFSYIVISSLPQNFVKLDLGMLLLFALHKWRFKQFGRLNWTLRFLVRSTSRSNWQASDDIHRRCIISQIRNLMVDIGRWSYYYNIILYIYT